MIEVGVDNPEIVKFIHKLEAVIDESVERLTLAELVGSIELVKHALVMYYMDEEETTH